ncbi:unnamed protein product [Protopolystoma xenopodis]|uniref:Uncharacterized protein n=1 Tax=Protopolystoma xenopodis TaxID=117903 RepID=A0A448WGU6_9PLAT|nr:unnamed protein product [Protopolystoma xenopodis]
MNREILRMLRNTRSVEGSSEEARNALADESETAIRCLPEIKQDKSSDKAFLGVVLPKRQAKRDVEDISDGRENGTSRTRVKRVRLLTEPSAPQLSTGERSELSMGNDNTQALKSSRLSSSSAGCTGEEEAKGQCICSPEQMQRLMTLTQSREWGIADQMLRAVRRDNMEGQIARQELPCDEVNSPPT